MELKITYKNGDIKTYPLNKDTKLYCYCEPEYIVLQNNIINCGLQYRDIWADIKAYGTTEIEKVEFNTGTVSAAISPVNSCEYQTFYRVTYDEYLHFRT